MENKTVRDTTFRHYFNGGHGNGNSNYRLLSLANTLKGTNYTAPDAIQINTLDGSFFSSLKNDISFLFDNRWMILLEHQSTINENMPIRLLGYVNEIYNLYLKPYRNQIYNKALIQLPTPEFHVFYDGDDDTKDSDFDYKLLRLSDSFIMPGGQLELTVNCYNLNIGKSLNLKKLCKPLEEYSIFSNHFKLYRKQGFSIKEATRLAINYCRENNIMSDYLSNNESEVIDMFGFEWNEKEEREALLEAGETRGNLKTLKNIMAKNNWPAERALEFMGIAKSQYNQYISLLQP